ncbi:MAG: hypothetical protein AVO39_00700 [delta proteobacterium MLS_D]|jgi:hypothetical protein|nr:MAG: hypothetical protein AVO39_00700 [delta proteobacterium MLS_D]
METKEKNIISPAREFLTWLWFKSEERNGTVMIPGLGDVEIMFVRRIVLESGEGEYSETVVCSGLHADLSEGKAALRTGKKVREARIKIGVGSSEWEFTFKADGFFFQSMTLPVNPDESDDEADKEARVLDRIGCMEKAADTMGRLFSLFNRLRDSETWTATEVPHMEAWISR